MSVPSQKSAPELRASHNSGERDPSVMPDSAGADTDLDDLQSELTDSLKAQGELRPLCLKAAQAIADLRSQLEEEEANAARAWSAWENARSQLVKANGALNAIQFIAILEVLEECADFVPDELEARVYNLLDYHRDHDTASKLSPLTDDFGEK